MKTSKSLSRQLLTALTCIILMAATSLVFTSCKKEELATPGQPSSSEESAKQINQSSEKIVFSSIMVNHYAGNSRLPDYAITVYSNGSAVYEGRKNVKTTGIREFQITNNALKRINNLSIQFMSLSTLPKAEEAARDAQAFNETTFIASGQTEGKLFRDYNNGQPEWLVKFRTEVEKAMNISKLIKAQNMIEVAE